MEPSSYRRDRGYRERRPEHRDRDRDRRPEYRDRSPGRRSPDRRSPDRRGPSRRSPTRRSDGDRYQSRQRSRSPRRRGGFRFKEKGNDDVGKSSTSGKKSKEAKAPKAPKVAAATAGQEFIIVHINDRLGTKTAIPCLPSDTVGQFKLMVAARIGREAGQIMLRRQGERPFKDHITLEDYGVSNGVQLDLEVDTGD